MNSTAGEKLTIVKHVDARESIKCLCTKETSKILVAIETQIHASKDYRTCFDCNLLGQWSGNACLPNWLKTNLPSLSHSYTFLSLSLSLSLHVSPLFLSVHYPSLSLFFFSYPRLIIFLFPRRDLRSLKTSTNKPPRPTMCFFLFFLPFILPFPREKNQNKKKKKN